MSASPAGFTLRFLTSFPATSLRGELLMEYGEKFGFCVDAGDSISRGAFQSSDGQFVSGCVDYDTSVLVDFQSDVGPKGAVVLDDFAHRQPIWRRIAKPKRELHRLICAPAKRKVNPAD